MIDSFPEYASHTHKTAKYPEDDAVLYLVLGLADELGEALEKARHEPRGGVNWKQKLTAEIGDVFWYVSELGRHLGHEFEEIPPHTHSPMEMSRGMKDLEDALDEATKACGGVKKAIRDDGGEITRERSSRLVRAVCQVKVKLESACHHFGLGPPEYVLERNLEKLQVRDAQGLIKGEGEGTNRVSTS